MTSQQAITLLRNLEQSLDDYCELNDEGKAAFNKAITALELFGNSEQLPSAQPEQCSDCIAHGGDWECDHMHCRKGRLPSAQPDVSEALSILDAIRAGGRVNYSDYCELHDAIAEIG